MGRLDQIVYSKNIEDIDWDNGLSAIVSDLSKKEDKILIVDADSIIHAAVHPKREEMRDPYTDEEVESIVIPKIKERLFSLKEEISKGFNILEMYCFIGGKGSYRRNLYPEYKANRKEKLDILPKVYEICCTDKDINFKKANDLCEADDQLFILAREYGELAILSYIDKDLNVIGQNIPVYNYNKNLWYRVSPEEARYNLAKQTGIGDASDNIIANKGLGEAKIKKYISLGMTDYQYMKGLIQAYRDYNKDVKDVKPLIRMTYKLVSLGKIYEK